MDENREFNKRGVKIADPHFNQRWIERESFTVYNIALFMPRHHLEMNLLTEKKSASLETPTLTLILSRGKRRGMKYRVPYRPPMLCTKFKRFQ